MAATREYFEDNTLNVQNGDTTDKVLIPTHLAEYGSTTGQIATKFKLDIVLPHHNGFLGGIVNGSTNHKYHNTHISSNGDNTSNPNRLSKLRIYKDGTEYALFNDGGVNTKPDCAFMNISDITNAQPFLLWAGFPQSKVGALFYPARFVNTTNRKVEIYSGSTLIDSYDNGSATQNSTALAKEQVLSTKALTEGQSVTLKLTTTNAEGTIVQTMTGSVGAAVDLPYLASYYADDLFRPQFPTSQESVYMFTSQSANLPNVSTMDTQTGIFLYTDMRMNRAVSTKPNLAPDGWYNFSGSRFYKVIGGQVRWVMESTPVTKKSEIVPRIINGNIGIEVLNAALSGSVTVNNILYYNSKTATASQGSQTINKTISNVAIGTIIDTGIAINKMGDYARFSLSSTSYGNPIVMLMSMDFEDK